MQRLGGPFIVARRDIAVGVDRLYVKSFKLDGSHLHVGSTN
jgi:hypothetical protein